MHWKTMDNPKIVYAQTNFISEPYQVDESTIKRTVDPSTRLCVCNKCPREYKIHPCIQQLIEERKKTIPDDEYTDHWKRIDEIINNTEY